MTTVKFILIVVLLLYAAIMDIIKREIPDVISCLILGVGLIDMSIINSLLGIALTGLPYFGVALTTSRENSLSVGGGDIKLIIACAFAFGSVSFSLLHNVVSLTLVIIYANLNKKSAKKGIALAPFIFLGSIVALMITLGVKV